MSAQITYRGEQEMSVAGLTLTLRFEVEADVTYAPARIWGLPEDSGPDESELDITSRTLTSVHDEDGNEVAFHAATQERLLGALNWESVEEKIWEQFHEERMEGAEPDGDDGYDLSD